MMTALLATITGNPIVRALGIAIMAVLGVLTFGAIKKREGAQDQKAKREAADARDYQSTMERMSDEEAKPRDADAVRERMRARDPAKR